MSYVAQLRDRIAGWVHESARAHPAEATRHQAFMAARLLISFMSIVVLPPYLALRGGLQAWEAVIALCAMVPILAVCVLSRTGNFALAQSIAAASYGTACFAMATGTGGLSAAALSWLVLAPVETLYAFSVKRLALTTAMSIGILVAIYAGVETGWIDSGQQLSSTVSMLFILPAFLHASMIAFAAMRMTMLRGRLERIGAARYQTLAGVMGDLVLRHDRGGAVLAVSREAETLFSLQSRDLMGRGLFERLMVQDRPLFLKTIADAYDTGETISCDLRLRTGSTPSNHGDFDEPVFTWVELRARRLAHVEASSRASAEDAQDDDGATVMAVVRDIEKEKRRQQEVEAARAEAERSNLWKDRFLANISHELRTPLNAIIGFSEILGNEDLVPSDPEKRAEYAHIIHGSGEHLLDVVNSILDISKMEAGRFSITPEHFEVAPLVGACCDIVSLKAQQAGVTIDRDTPDNLDELIADKRAFKQVLINLLGNAIKFTPRHGRVTVGARQDGAHMRLFVSDTGTGMSAYDLPRLGDAFFQAGGAGDRTYEGTGLGLSVVRGLVGLHGGEISVESGPGLGTCVTVRLPVDCRSYGAPRGSARITVIPRVAPVATIIDPVGTSSEEVRKRA